MMTSWIISFPSFVLGSDSISDFNHTFLPIYYRCYQAFKLWGWTADMSDNLLRNIKDTGLFNSCRDSEQFKAIAVGGGRISRDPKSWKFD